MCEEREIKNFADVSAAVDFLVSEGWKITRSSFYRHRVEGKIRRQANNTYTLAAVRKYAKTFCRRRDAKTLLKEALARELANQSSLLRTEISTVFRIRAGEIIRLVSGDPARVDALVSFFETHFNDENSGK
ncbi:MAG: hypothetical protein ABH891_00040 [Candidatus Omnitrophota bacterium]